MADSSAAIQSRPPVFNQAALQLAQTELLVNTQQNRIDENGFLQALPTNIDNDFIKTMLYEMLNSLLQHRLITNLY